MLWFTPRMSSPGGGLPPATVRRASVFIAVCAALSATGTVVALSALHHLSTASVRYLGLVGEENLSAANDRVTTIHGNIALDLVLSVAGVLLLTPIAAAVRRPWRSARVLAWSAGLLLCAGLALAIPTGSDALLSGSALDNAQVRAALADLLPGWYADITTLLIAAQFGATIGFGVLLMRATSGEFYNPPATEGPAGLWTFVRREDREPGGTDTGPAGGGTTA